MRIDHTRVAIRERTWLDNLDLAMHFFRVNFRSCLGAAVAGATPFILINSWVLSVTFETGLSEQVQFEMIYLSTLLVMVEAPLATAPLTLLLGQVMFVERANRRKIGNDLLASLPQMILFQVLLRTMLVVPLFTLILPYGMWPYLNEIILLERTPLLGREGQLSTQKRSSIVHRGGGGENIVRAAVAAILSALLAIALWTASRILLDMLFGLELGLGGQALLVQVILWSVAAFFTVARFLSYLDQRIRNEGWEVELALRAQRQRLLRHAV